MVGKKEDVSDIITNIAPTQTPFQTMIGAETAWNILYQWQEDSLDAPAANAQVEGAAAIASTFSPTVMRSNTTQIFMKTASATGSTDAIKAYGRGKELAYQLTKKSKEIKRDFEYALVGTGQTQVAGSDTVARQFGGYQSQIDATHVFPAATTGTALLTENLVLSANQQLYIDGGEATVLMIKPSDSLIVAGFSAAAGRQRYINNGDKKIVNVVDVYVSPFGEQKVVINRWQATTNALLFDPSFWKKITFRNWFRETLAKTGDATNIMLVGEFGLKHRNYKASALLSALA
jgi:hypothetical protein